MGWSVNLQAWANPRHAENNGSMLSLGILYALLAAFSNSAIDATRKKLASKVPSTALVALPALLEALVHCTFITTFGRFDSFPFDNPHALSGLAVLSASMLLSARLLYQSALASGPLSLTVPYLSFTPAILVAIAFLFLGETVSAQGGEREITRPGEPVLSCMSGMI
jgi:drug/metabolite transporter (DMT)-like permease